MHSRIRSEAWKGLVPARLWSAHSILIDRDHHQEKGKDVSRHHVALNQANSKGEVEIHPNGLADQMYAADMGGQLWRFDFTPFHTGGDLVAGGVIARLQGSGVANKNLL